MTTEPLVLITDHGAVQVLTHNRPAARNALSRDLGLDDQFRAVSERNKQQIERPE